MKTRYSYFEYQIMPFELTNALAIFQSYINKILAEKFKVVIIVYFNDMFIYIKNERKKYMEIV